MRQRVFISIDDEALHQLAIIAAIERREVRDQAAIMLEMAIKTYDAEYQKHDKSNTGAAKVSQAKAAAGVSVNP